MYIQKVTAQTIAVSGTGQAAETAITLPSTFIPAAGAIYDILLKTQIPEGTNGTIVTIAGEPLLQRVNGDYARARGLGWRKVLRVQYFADPAHFNLLAVRG